MAQQQQEVAAAAKSQKAKAQANAAAAMMSELKTKVVNGKPKDSRKIGKDEMYHGALEDILTGMLSASSIGVCSAYAYVLFTSAATCLSVAVI